MNASTPPPFPRLGETLRLGLQPLNLQDWIHIDAEFAPQLALKERLLQERYAEVFASLPGSQAAQTEVLNVLLEHLARYFPQTFAVQRDRIENRVMGQAYAIADFADNPLDLVGRLVQEDFGLMSPQPEGYSLAAASICFPLRWRMQEKLGKPLGQIHQPVPGYARKLQHPVDNVFARLKSQAPTWRINWAIVETPELFLPPAEGDTASHAEIAPENAGERLWLRLERQTLRRLEQSGAILFGIRTYIQPFRTLEAATRRDLADILERMSPQTLDYKNITPLLPVLRAYLT